MNTNGDDESGKKKCAPVLEDYYECMHHKKEVSLESTSIKAEAIRAHTLRVAGRTNDGATDSVQQSPIESRKRGRAYSRADTEFRSTGQRGGYKEGVGFEILKDREGSYAGSIDWRQQIEINFHTVDTSLEGQMWLILKC